MISKKMALRASDTSLIAALGSVTSPWQDLGRHCAFLSITRTSTNGTYAIEIEWSVDGGSTVLTTDTPTTVAGTALEIPAKARWFRARFKNTHATLAFTAHDSKVSADAAGGAGG